jgi:hypothetical protein
MLEYIKFYNPTKSVRTSTLVLNFKGLLKELVISFVLTPLKTVKPLPRSITGVISTTRKPGTIGPGCHRKHGKHCPHHGHHGDEDNSDHDHDYDYAKTTSCSPCQLLKCTSCYNKHPHKTCPYSKFFSQFTPTTYIASPSSLVFISNV